MPAGPAKKPVNQVKPPDVTKDGRKVPVMAYGADLCHWGTQAEAPTLLRSL